MRISSLLVLTLAFAPWTLFGQSESGGAAIEGVVLDPNGGIVGKAVVEVRGKETGYNRKTLTAGDGRFSIPVLPVGEYAVTVVAPGFARTTLNNVRLAVGARSSITVRLNLESIQAQINVSAEAAQIDPAETATSSSIGEKAVSDLPIRGRNFTEFVQLTPGVVQESDRSGLVIAGQRSINSNVAIDGADFNDALQGNQRGGNQATFFFPQSAVREFQVVRTGATAEVGRTNAGFVNVVTRSGANSVHGDAFYFNRNKTLTWPDAFGRSLDNRQNQFGGSVGGPIRRDKAFFFAAIEQNLLRVPFVVQFQQQAANVVVPADLKALEGEQHGSNNPTALFLRQDTILTSKHSLSMQYTFSRMRGENFNFDSPQQDVAASANYGMESASHAGKVSLVSALTSSLVNELRGQIATDDRLERPNSVSGNITITGFGTIGGDSGRPRAFEATRYQATDNVSWRKGIHQIRSGFDLNINSMRQERESNVQGRYDFKSLSDYVSRKINRFRQTLPGFDPRDLIFDAAQRELAFFVTDKIDLRRDLVLTGGLRWEGQWNPTPPRPNPAIPATGRIPDDLGQWQPRLGLAWSPGASNKTVLRAAAGIYTARTPANLFQRVFTDNGITTVAVDSKTDSSILNFAQFPNSLTTLPAGQKVTPPRVFGFIEGFRNPRSGQISGTVERQITNDVKISVGYVRNSTWNLQRRVDRNLFAPTINAAGMPIFPSLRPNPTIGVFSLNESSAHSNYDGLLFSADKRFSRRFQMQMNYTFARNNDDDSNERNFSRELALNPFDLSIEASPSKQDVRHNININNLVQLPWGVNFSAILMTRSGFPYTPVTGSDTQNDANDDNDRVIINGKVAGRSSMRQPHFFNLDLRLMKNIRLGESRTLAISAEGFNVTKTPNRNYGNDSVSIYGTPDSPVVTAGQALFAPSTARFGGPKQLQLGARFTF